MSEDVSVAAPPVCVDLAEMTGRELVAYVQGGGDLSTLIRDHGVRGPVPSGPPPTELPMLVTGIRLPLAMCDAVDRLAGDSKGGRSGVIRAALAEYLEKHRDDLERHTGD